MNFHLIAFEDIVNAIFLNARKRVNNCTTIDMSKINEETYDVFNQYQEALKQFISKDDICVHTLDFGLDLYNRLKQTTTENFFWKDMEDKTYSTDFVMCLLFEKFIHNYLLHLQNLFNIVQDATTADDDVPILFIKMMMAITFNDNMHLNDNMICVVYVDDTIIACGTRL